MDISPHQQFHRLRSKIDAIERLTLKEEERYRIGRFTDLIYELVDTLETRDEEDYILEQVENNPYFVPAANGHYEWNPERCEPEWVEE